MIEWLGNSNMSSKYWHMLSASGSSGKPVQSQFGEKMLRKMGWKEGEGLGKSGAPATEPIRLQQRPEGMALGQDRKKTKWNDAWWEDLYNSVAEKVVVPQPTKRRKLA